MKTMRLYLCGAILLLAMANAGLAQSVSGYVDRGEWKSVSLSPVMPRSESQIAVVPHGRMTPATSHYQLLFSSTDHAEAFTTGYFVYSYPTSFNALDLLGDGKKAFVVTTTITDSSKVSTSYFSPTTFQPLWTVEDTGYGDASIKTQIINAQISGTSDPEYVVWRWSGDSLPAGATLFRVHSKLSGSTLFKGVARSDSTIAYFFPVNFLEQAGTNFDLNGNGYVEFMRASIPKNAGLMSTLQVSVYDNLNVIDVIDFSVILTYNATTTNDVNSDGKPEIMLSSAMAPTFYQWNSSSSHFEPVASLDAAMAMWKRPENVDNDPGKEIIVQTDVDSVVVYSSSFARKYAVGVPSDLTIARFFVENVNATTEKELILVAGKLGDAGTEWTTFVYDFGTGTSPVWADTNFQAQAVLDLRQVGHSELFGFTRNGSARLIDGTNSFQPVWTLGGGTYSLAGPYVASPYDITDPMLNLLLAFLGGCPPGVLATDFDGHGTNDLVLKTRDASYYTALVVVDANGAVIDTLPGVQQPSSVQAHDFNNNGRPELLVTDNLGEVYLFEQDGTTSVSGAEVLPREYRLEQNYPNPFNPSTVIRYYLPTAGSVRLTVYDLLGKSVCELVNEGQSAGWKEVEWNALGLSSGVYAYRIDAVDQGGRQFTTTRTMVLLK
jgi:hypothetical protein